MPLQSFIMRETLKLLESVARAYCMPLQFWQYREDFSASHQTFSWLFALALLVLQVPRSALLPLGLAPALVSLTCLDLVNQHRLESHVAIG